MRCFRTYHFLFTACRCNLSIFYKLWFTALLTSLNFLALTILFLLIELTHSFCSPVLRVPYFLFKIFVFERELLLPKIKDIYLNNKNKGQWNVLFISYQLWFNLAKNIFMLHYLVHFINLMTSFERTQLIHFEHKFWEKIVNAFLGNQDFTRTISDCKIKLINEMFASNKE